MIQSTFGKIACTPFPDNSVKTEKHGDGEFHVVKVANTKTTLVKLKVLSEARFAVGSSLQYIPSESYVWVRADLYASDYGKQIFLAGSEPFILLPIDRIEVFESRE